MRQAHPFSKREPATPPFYSRMGSCWLRTNITGSATSASLPAAGVYGFTLTFADGVGGIVIANTISGTATMIVIYDPSAGFVTGGGWIMSPAGAYYADPSLAGKANFGFVSKYQKGATVPTGDTQFTFQTGNLDSTALSTNGWSFPEDWLSTKAAARSTALATYTFILTARDGALYSTGTPDGFRIKITDAGI